MEPASGPPIAPRFKIVAGVFLSLVLILLLAASMTKELDHDEHQFVASGKLLADRFLLPYKDYPYFHVPNLVLIYAALFKVADYPLLVARLFSVVCAWLTVVTVFIISL